MVDSNPLKHTNQISFLYVDDEEELLTIAKLFLERTGEFRVDIAKSAQEVLQSGSLQSYDAIISDYQMPGMNGIPFILFTGKGREEVVIEAINNGADFYLQKGGDPKSQFAELSHKIKQAVRRKRAERSFQDSQKELGDIIDFLPDPTFVIDKSGTIISWNHAIEKMTGHSARKMLGKGNYEYAIPLWSSTPNTH
jgi:CheY-like chemotaxis protein